MSIDTSNIIKNEIFNNLSCLASVYEYPKQYSEDLYYHSVSEFLTHATPEVDQVIGDYNAALNEFKELVTFFGMDSGMDCNEFFGYIDKFCVDFKAALQSAK